MDQGTAAELFSRYVMVMSKIPEIRREIVEYEESVRDAAGAEIDFVL